MKKDNPDYSIIIPVYCNEDTILECFNTLNDEVIKVNSDKSCEVVFVDDGSIDNSLNIILEIKKNNPGLVKVVKLTRNFGQVFAIAAGYKIAGGRCLINISADLQDPPQLINQMLDYYDTGQYEIVIGVRGAREESLYRRITSKIFYRIIKILSFSNMPLGGFDFALISNKVKRLILNEKDANPFWQGQILWTGYRIKFISYLRKNRQIGKSQSNFSMKLKYLIDGVMSYSYFPLRLISILGCMVALMGFIYAIVILFVRLFTGGIPFKGWTPIMIIILILSGIQMIMLGTVGEYLWRALAQVRRRETYVIDKVYE